MPHSRSVDPAAAETMQIKPRLVVLRRAVQLLCLFVFLLLFRLTDYSGADTIPYAVNVWFRMDPLVLFTVTLAQKMIVWALWPAVVMMVLTLFLGRFFCGWICPVGTLLDMAGRFIKSSERSVRLRYLKYILLIIMLISAAFGVQLLGYLDPFSLLVRGMVFSIDPAFNYLISGFFDSIYTMGPQWLSAITEPVYNVFKAGILPFKQSYFYLSFISFFILVVIVFLEKLGRRFWCRNLCPLGAVYALTTRFSIFKRKPYLSCRHCKKCSTDCRMNAFDENDKLMSEECTLCMDCLKFCPDQITTFKFVYPFYRSAPMDISRRQVLTAGIAGALIPAVIRTSAGAKQYNEFIIRPPGAQDEAGFLAACVRCGECMKVCINNALQPLGLQKGLEGVFTPVLVPRLGYCEFNCTLCSQVCPTEAIRKLDIQQKHRFVIGRAAFDHSRCLVYAQKKECIVCEEHCPTYDKAIKFHIVEKNPAGETADRLMEPYVIPELCIGCGICENVCPVQGQSAVRVSALQPEKTGSSGYG